MNPTEILVILAGLAIPLSLLFGVIDGSIRLADRARRRSCP